jgi:hypothetical protein
LLCKSWIKLSTESSLLGMQGLFHGEGQLLHAQLTGCFPESKPSCFQEEYMRSSKPMSSS